MQDFSDKYNKNDFWSKVANVFKSAGRELIEKALTLYYCFEDPLTPLWVKSMIIAALGYFIFPADTVPDCLPVVGYSDDLGVLAGVYVTISAYITDEHIEKAKRKTDALFGCA